MVRRWSGMVLAAWAAWAVPAAAQNIVMNSGPQPSRSGVTALAFTPDGKTLLSAGTDGVIRWHDAETGKETRRVEPGMGVLYALAVAPDGKRFAVGGMSGPVRLYDLD